MNIYVYVKGIKNGEISKARFLQKNEEIADQFIEKFHIQVSGTKSTAQLLREQGWEEFKAVYKRVEE